MATTKSYFRREGDVPLLDCTIPEHFAGIVSRYSDQQAVVSVSQKQSLNYSELSCQIDNLAKALIYYGFGQGDCIGIWSTNNLEWIIVQMATARIGAILVNINPAYRTQELKFALQRSQVQCLFIIPSFRKSNYQTMMTDLLPELRHCDNDHFFSTVLPDLRRIIVFDPKNQEQPVCAQKGFTPWTKMLDGAQWVSSEQLETISASLNADDTINIQYTSGTTGFPKAVMLSHHNILNNAYFAAQAMYFNHQDRLCVPVPFYHCFGMVLANLLCFSVGATVVIACDYFDAEAVLETIEQQHCTAVHGVPTMFIAELELPNFNQFNLHTLRTGIMAGAPCPSELMKRVMRDMHCQEILIAYGQTEASPITHLTSREDSLERRTETVGKNLPHQEVKIIDIDSGELVSLGEAGEICFRGYHVMQGYYADSEATAKAIDKEGWLHSGDLGSMDEEGYLKITGRLKDLVIRGGENIYPREIEDTIFSHPKVVEVAVFGLPDDFYGEELVAWIRLHPGETSCANEIQEYCKNKLAHYKIPTVIRFVDCFPMTVTAKLQKFRMREIMIAEGNDKT